jgi:hypothetical protein
MSPSFIINILPHHTLSNHPLPHHRTRSRRRRPLLPVTTSVALRIGPSSVMRPPPCQTPLKAPVRGSSPSDASSPQQVTTVSCCKAPRQWPNWATGSMGSEASSHLSAAPPAAGLPTTLMLRGRECWKYALESTGFDALVGSDGFDPLVGSDGFDPLWCKSLNEPQML